MVGGSIRKTRAGLIRVRVALAGEVIKSVLVSGDFFATTPVIAGLESRLKWSAAERGSIQRAIEEEFSSPERSIFGLEPGELADSIMAAVEDARAKGRV
ncbi:MAG: lipoate protein ligase C-terminal domain-containing protein, partial [Chloroflexota bacterium]|nr:lipoate protein ligase C-terminal domain-containing protein [Chloroflexota bacterium]